MTDPAEVAALARADQLRAATRNDLDSLIRRAQEHARACEFGATCLGGVADTLFALDRLSLGLLLGESLLRFAQGKRGT